MITDNQARILTLFANHEFINTKGQLEKLVNQNMNKPLMDVNTIDKIVSELSQMGYIEQILGPTAIPFKITERGNRAFGEVMRADAEKVIEDYLKKRQRESLSRELLERKNLSNSDTLTTKVNTTQYKKQITPQIGKSFWHEHPWAKSVAWIIGIASGIATIIAVILQIY